MPVSSRTLLGVESTAVVEVEVDVEVEVEMFA